MTGMTRRSLLAATPLLAAPLLAHAEAPGRDVSFLIPYAPGGGFDLYVRTVIPAMQKALGVTIVPNNVEGAGGARAANMLDRARPDGATIGVLNIPGLLLLDGLGFDVTKLSWIGNLGRDPEVRRTGAGDPVVSFSVATTESWRDKASGERKDRTEWHNVVIFNENLGKIAEQYLKKGAKVYLEGQLQTREYTDKDGNQRKVTEVVLQRFRGELTLLDSRGGGREGGEERGSYGQASSGGSSFGRSSPMERRPAAAPAGGGGGRMADPIDDDIPF